MRKLIYSVLFLSVFFTSCEENLELPNAKIEEQTVDPELRATVKNEIIHFSNYDDFKRTVAFLINNPDYSFSSLYPTFESFQEVRLKLELSSEKPNPQLFQKYFREMIIEGEKVTLPKITDEIFEKLLNKDGLITIGDEIYGVEDNSLYKFNSKVSNVGKVKISDIQVEIQRLNSSIKNPNTRGINGGGNWFCSGKEYRLLGNLVNFNIGIFQRLSIQVKYQRKNQSFWSWIDPWLAENGSLFYNASFTIQPAGGIPPINVNLSDSCGWCDSFNRTVDWNIGVAGPTVWSNQSGTFGGTVACGYRTYNF